MNIIYRKYPKGFTLLELMIVIVILGMLATIIMPKIIGKPQQARRQKAEIEIKSIEAALNMFETETGRLPTTSEGLQALVTDPGIAGYQKGGYLDKITDPWGNNYIYINPGRHNNRFDLISYGKDGEKGGVDDNADIENWNIK